MYIKEVEVDGSKMCFTYVFFQYKKSIVYHFVHCTLWNSPIMKSIWKPKNEYGNYQDPLYPSMSCSKKQVVVPISLYNKSAYMCKNKQ
jgi:hypothetical protein